MEDISMLLLSLSTFFSTTNFSLREGRERDDFEMGGFLIETFLK